MLTGIEIMVVDEADRMLDMGFIPDIEKIFKLTPFTRQTLFFSATMPPEITRLTEEFLHNPKRVEVARQATTGENIAQKIVYWRASSKENADREKRDVLRALIDMEGEKLKNGIVFCNRKVDVDIVAKSLTKHGYNAAAIHGDLDQKVRTRTLDSFRDGSLHILVASDVAARGLDIPAVSHVFNYDVPIHSEDYVHRIGRTGRAGRKGDAFTLCLPRDEKYLEKIEEMTESKVERIDPPEGAVRPVRGGDRAPREDRSAAGEKSRSRGSRSRSRRDEASDAPQSAEAAKADEVKAEEPAAAEAAPTAGAQKSGERKDRSGGRGRKDGRQDNRGKGNGGKPVLGLGDHVPAFMQIPLPDLKKSAKKTEEEDSAEEAA